MTDPDFRSRHCAEPAVEAVFAACGKDVWAEWGGCPRSWREAADLYRRMGVRTLAEAVTVAIGPPLASPLLAKRGDIVMVQGALGVCRGDIVECMGDNMPLDAVTIAWSAHVG